MHRPIERIGALKSRPILSRSIINIFGSSFRYAQLLRQKFYWSEYEKRRLIDNQVKYCGLIPCALHQSCGKI